MSKPKVQVTVRCGMCKRQVPLNKPHKCPMRKKQGSK
jgi:hypothetical protein